ncbi:MAG: phosphoribosyl-AMP cyclohydrolase [Actinomycetia bacterium]|nr:phosphoribosyl-AMP cyclohydrolase [Actinomycetes bacterium]
MGVLRFDEQGLIPAIVQQVGTGEVLMMAWMNAEALRLTQQTGETWFWSRSRSELWHKGATSGNTQKVASIMQDCDSDCLLVWVDSPGPACHTGNRSCFYREVACDGAAADGGDASGRGCGTAAAATVAATATTAAAAAAAAATATATAAAATTTAAAGRPAADQKGEQHG